MSVHATASVHSTAIVNSEATIGSRTTVGPYAVIEKEVFIGADCEIGAQAVIKSYTLIGERNRVFEHAVIGGEPQDVKFKGEPTSLVIGDDNLIREFCTLHRACGEGQVTRIGSRNFFMVGVHIAHNCIIGDDNIFTNGAALAGHVEVEDHAFLSNNVGVHQFVRLGRYAMVGGKSKIVQDVLPFFITDGNPARVRGVNSIGLRRAGLSGETRRALKKAYQLLFRSSLSLKAALHEMENLNDRNVGYLVNFIRGSKRGFTRSAKRDDSVEEESLQV